MDEREDNRREDEFVAKERHEKDDECASISDPIRRNLCRVCQKPVIGEAPFCKDHEFPVP
jgi:hypothetical protein